MLYQSAAADSLKLSAFTDKDKAFVNAILDDTCAVNTGVIQSLTKIVAKTTLAAVSVSYFTILWVSVTGIEYQFIMQTNTACGH